MKSLKVAILVVALVLAGQSIAGAQVSFGIRIGPPPPPYVVSVYPPSPGLNHVWVDGYWYPYDHHYRWHNGYWTRPPYPGAYWVAPRYDNDLYFRGYWAEHHHEHHGGHERHH